MMSQSEKCPCGADGYKQIGALQQWVCKGAVERGVHDGHYDSTDDTLKHISVVQIFLAKFSVELDRRAREHDQSKLQPPEKEMFDEFTPKLRDSTYGSEEYEQFREEMGEALKHHYAVNDHHPEHFKQGEAHEVEIEVSTKYHPSGDEYTWTVALCSGCNWSNEGDEADVRGAADLHEREANLPHGIHAMGLHQLVEMLCDWMAATQRHADDHDIRDSIKQNAVRFGYGEEIEQLLLNTVSFLEGK